MAHFARIDENNIVIQVIVVADSDCGGGQYPDSDPIGAAFCNNLLGGTWKQTSYNNNFRKNYAGIGYIYDAENDMFVAPQPYPSWILDAEGEWQPPIPIPKDNGVGDPPKFYQWNEDTINWIEVLETK